MRTLKGKGQQENTFKISRTLTNTNQNNPPSHPQPKPIEIRPLTHHFDVCKLCQTELLEPSTSLEAVPVSREGKGRKITMAAIYRTISTPFFF